MQILCFCHPHTTTSYKNCKDSLESSDQHIFPGQALKFNVALFGWDYFFIKTPTDGTVQIFITRSNNNSLLNQTYIPNTCSLIEYTPKLTQTGYQSYFITSPWELKALTFIILNFIVKECPIGFSIDKSQGSCTCSQSVSRENVTCNINSLNITHNGLLWIGTYHAHQYTFQS